MSLLTFTQKAYCKEHAHCVFPDGSGLHLVMAECGLIFYCIPKVIETSLEIQC